jgi:hypothetical protein
MAPPESRVDPHGVKLGDAGFQAQIYGAAWKLAVTSYKEYLALRTSGDFARSLYPFLV